MVRKFILFTSLHCLLFGLGFGGMGNTSAGLGNSGVALRKSAWGIYYNPALLASDNRGKFGYSVGLKADGSGIQELLTSISNPEDILYQARSRYSLDLDSQNGIVIQITGGVRQIPKLDQNGNPTEEKIEVRSPIGAFTMAAFASFYASGYLDKAINAGQIDSSLNLAGVGILEVPVGWGWRFETKAGDVSIGAAIKYMGAIGFDINGNLSSTNEFDEGLQFNFPQEFALSHWFGIDLGILYTPIKGLNLGLVAKNINVPTFNVNGHKFKIDPQFRFGLSYEFAKYFAVTFDSDLAPNRTFLSNSPKTQTIGGGLLMDFKYIDLRFGLMGDMANKFEQGVIMTGGINLLGFLDVAVQASSKMFSFQGYKIPQYMSIKVGGSFTF